LFPIHKKGRQKGRNEYFFLAWDFFTGAAQSFAARAVRGMPFARERSLVTSCRDKKTFENKYLSKAETVFIKNVSFHVKENQRIFSKLFVNGHKYDARAVPADLNAQYQCVCAPDGIFLLTVFSWSRGLLGLFSSLWLLAVPLLERGWLLHTIGTCPCTYTEPFMNNA
jgi:hypothetical protein